jgi:hypothetical protein
MTAELDGEGDIGRDFWNHEPTGTSSAGTIGTEASAVGRRTAEAPEPRLPEAADRVLSPSASTVFTETVPPTSQHMYRAGAETTAQGASGQALSYRTGRQVEYLKPELEGAIDVGLAANVFRALRA